MKKIFVHLATGFEEIEAVSTIDILRRAELEVVTVSVTGDKSVVGAHNIPVVADALFEEVDYGEGQMIVLPGGVPGTQNLEAHKGLADMIREYQNQDKYLAAVCAAPSVFGKLGILKDHEVVCYPGFEQYLEGAKVLNTAVIQSGKVITGRGAGPAVKFALKIVEALIGKEEARRIGGKMLVE